MAAEEASLKGHNFISGRIQPSLEHLQFAIKQLLNKGVSHESN